VTERWPVEEIPDQDRLFMRVHRQWLKNGRVAPGFFQNRPDEATGAMSTDWSRYATPEETRARAKRPELNAVIELAVGIVRAIPEQVVRHAPIQDDPNLPDNRAHTDVAGPKETGDLEIQDTYSRIARLVIRVDAC
jgi:hypothetical protein